MKTKRIFALALSVLLLTSCTRQNKNSNANQNSLRVAVTGLTSQIFIYPLAKENLVAVAEPMPECFDCSLPVLGPLHGTRGDMNIEELIKVNPDLVIDIGEAKKGLTEELDDLTKTTGIKFVHIDCSFEKTGDMYRELGKLLHKEKEAEKFAEYCDQTYSKMKSFSKTIDKKKFLYVIGSKGTNVIAKNSYHSDIIDMLTENAAVIETPSGKGTGNTVDMEQIIKWNPDYIVFSPDSIYEKVAQMPEWQTVNAIKNNHYYKVPDIPYNWFGFPPAVNRYIGMYWLCDKLYRNESSFDFAEEYRKYFELFYKDEYKNWNIKY